MTFIDFLKKTFVYTMKSKFIMFDKFKGFQIFGGKEIEKKIKVIKCDGSG